jgi:LacI family transcriptional regulator
MTLLRIKDIAERLGVSVATVSRALNDKPGVSDEVRQRVLDLAAEVAFTPHSAGRGLSTARTQMLGFIVQRKVFPASRDPFYLHIMHGVEEAAAQRGYHVILSSVGDTDGARQTPVLPLVRENRVDGLILAGPDLDRRLILALQQAGMPLVLVDNFLRQTPLDVILSDDREGARAVVAHLLAHGHEQIAFLGGPADWISTAERAAGYHEALAAAGKRASATVVHEAETTVESGYQATRRVLEHTPAPTALFAVNDSMAIGALRALREAGRRVPEEVAVAGFDDIDAAQHTHPPLTTARIFKEQLGRVAAQRLLDRLADPATPVQRTYVGTALIIRRSCGCTPAPVGEEVSAGNGPG